MKSVKIQIPDMQSAHCQMRVTNALKEVEGVSIQKIEPGVASIEVDGDTQQNNALHAIEKAGYRVQQVDSTSQDETGSSFF